MSETPPSSAVERIELCKSHTLTCCFKAYILVLFSVLKTCFVHDPPSQFAYQLNEGHQATLSGFGRRFQYSHAYEPAAKEGVYRAALCRNILATVLEAAQLSAGEDGMKPQRVAELKDMSMAYSQMGTLAPLPKPQPEEEEPSVKPVPAVLAAASFPTPPPSVTTTQPTSPPALDLFTYPHLPSSFSASAASITSTAGPPAAPSRPSSSTPAPLPPQAAQYKASLPTSHVEQKVKPEDASSEGRARPISHEATDLQAWTDLLREPIPDTAYDRLSRFLSLHFGQCRSPEVYKPFIQFRYNEEGGASLTLIREVAVWPRSRLLPKGSYSEHAEQMSVSKLKDGFLKKCLKKKQPKAAFSTIIQKMVAKYSNLSSLCTASKALANIPVSSQKNIEQAPSSSGTLSASAKQKQPIKIAGSAVSKASSISHSADASIASVSAKRTAAPMSEGPRSAKDASLTDRGLPDMPKAMRHTESISTSSSSNARAIQTLPASLPDRPKALRALASPAAPVLAVSCKGEEEMHTVRSDSGRAGSMTSGSFSSFGLPSKPAFEPAVPLSPKAADYSMRLRDHYAPTEKQTDQAVTSPSMRAERSTSGEPSERRKRRARSPLSTADGRIDKRRRSDSVADREYRSERDDNRDRRRRASASARRSRSPNMYRPEDRRRYRSRSRSRSPERRIREKERSHRRRSDDDEDRHSSRRRRSDDEPRKSRRNSYDDSDHAKRRRGSDGSITSSVDDKAMLAILDLFAGTATGKLDLAEAIKQAAGLALSSDIRASTLAVLQAIYEASPQYLMQKSDIPAGTECVMLPKTWVEETMKLLSC